MTTKIHVLITRLEDKRRINLLVGLANGFSGVEWDFENGDLVFSGTGLKETYANALHFYRNAESHGYMKILARMRHRLGRNGHGWPDV